MYILYCIGILSWCEFDDKAFNDNVGLDTIGWIITWIFHPCHFFSGANEKSSLLPSEVQGLSFLPR